MENLQEVHDLPSLIPSSRFRMVPGGELAPFVSARAHLETHLHRVVLCWERWRRLRRKDGIPRSIAGGGEAGETDEQTPSLAQLHAAIRHVDDVLLAQSGQESELPIALLQRRFSLSHLEIRALLLAAASSLIPELSFRISEILRQERGSIPVRCLLEIVTEDEEERE